MFTGIIEATGVITELHTEGTNVTFSIESPISHELKIDQSVSHNGVCLTVIALGDGVHQVTAIDETLKKSNLGHLQVGSLVNLERCMQANGRFDGHIVQGHVDQTAICTQIQDENGSWLFDFEYDASVGNVTVEKGSICINGVSLTVFNSEASSFRVAIIPYTYTHTTFSQLKVGDSVNLEFDIVGKYVKRLLGQA
ncbi:riboflavin synthase [Siphonobacter sp. SORGH_AS_0500]|uniref:riboflavin synthase n=1 Tax=Siphonobacter sp. SORGH_AS_0500 TaxID=1864824 RepID=UPI000CB7AAEC|nr:riboflavin synthase [Siphonobacter sp. SORGH_AS_0500]MDR6196243.1 riboflavin synthase [Siphonobacter sp. SORGH_AS_0500]PKK38144.1 riboflavin synthase [Siphonobacter sp. SORGH_AS_0500]